MTFGTLRNGSAQSVCVEQGLCTLADPVVTAGDPDDLGGVDECLIREQSDIRYDPPARGGVFPEGATVTAHVDCTDPDAEESDGTDTGETNPDDHGTDDSTGDGTEDSPDDGTEGTDGEGTDGEGTDGEGTDGEGTDGEGTDGEGTDGDGADQSQG
ncbi:hypothetical protein [Blastococcus brunescens]|uniref:Uncharacterized protein n=1 Tax=Blastococcus brunescens TaxID=1564165 RepID=A0ABZ1AZF4_9ACTN|nr:hypothetical protein [Blastococcus sp. BMG 8361]WRL63939.1 hypothetical protein U6N30_30780 [Blastococcus sp. BMG 8361]